MTELINTLTSCMTEKFIMLTSSVPPKDSLWLGNTVTFATKVARKLSTCVQEDLVCEVVNQIARIVLFILRAVINQVEEQASSVKLAVLSLVTKLSGQLYSNDTLLFVFEMLIVTRYNTTSLHCNLPLLKERVLCCSKYIDHASQEVH